MFQDVFVVTRLQMKWMKVMYNMTKMMSQDFQHYVELSVDLADEHKMRKM